MATESTLGGDGVLRSAYISADLQYRYQLDRAWGPERGRILFVMLNPSRADGLRDDHTITKCMRFARDWEYGGLVVANLFDYRSPCPEALLEVDDPVGPENDATLTALRDSHVMTICAWGNNGRLMGRDKAVFNLQSADGRRSPRPLFSIDRKRESLSSEKRPVWYFTDAVGRPIRRPGVATTALISAAS